jgi:hypothetical protein
MAVKVHDDDGNVIGYQSPNFREARPDRGDPGAGWRIMSDGWSVIGPLAVRAEALPTHRATD